MATQSPPRNWTTVRSSASRRLNTTPRPATNLRPRPSRNLLCSPPDQGRCFRYRTRRVQTNINLSNNINPLTTSLKRFGNANNIVRRSWFAKKGEQKLCVAYIEFENFNSFLLLLILLRLLLFKEKKCCIKIRLSFVTMERKML